MNLEFKAFIFTTFLLSSVNSFGQSIVPLKITDTELEHGLNTKKIFGDKKMVRTYSVPLILLATTPIVWGERTEIRNVRNTYIPNFKDHYDDYAQYLPGATVFGLNAIGIKGKHTLLRAGTSYVFSAIFTAVAINAIKYTAKVERPDGSAKNSFPSGHTANAFMNATFLHKEYGQYRNSLYSVGGYMIASATGVGRLLNNRHWVSDIFAGAAIGIISTELGYLVADRVFKDKGENPDLHKSPGQTGKKPSFSRNENGTFDHGN